MHFGNDFYAPDGSEPIRGGVGAVYKVTKSDDTREYALKLIPLDGSILEYSFTRESAALRRLKHPNIQELAHNTWIREVNGRKFGILVSLWQDSTLAETIDGSAPYNWTKALETLALPLARALSYCHEIQLAHRDVKPSNIFMSQNSKLVLGDFGIAKPMQPDDSSQTVGIWRSGPYTPEILGNPYQIDVYSFGMTVLAALMGRTLFSRNDALSYLEKGMPRSGNARILLPQGAIEILRKCIEESPENRYTSMLEVLAALLAHRIEFIRDSGVREVIVEIPTSVLRSLNRNRIDNRNALAFVKEEFSSPGLGIEPIFDETGEPSRSDFWILAVSVKFRVSVVSDSKLLCNSLQHLSAERLDPQKKSGLPIDELALVWNVVSEAGSNFETNGIKQLLRRIYSWFDSGMPQSSNGRSAGSFRNLNATWTNILDATEAAMRGGGTPIRFTRLERRGKTVSLNLENSNDVELVGTFWEFSEDKRITGEIVHQEADSVVIALDREPKAKMSQVGQIAPSLNAGARSALSRKRSALESLTNGTALRRDLSDYLGNPRSVSPLTPARVETWNPDLALDDSKRGAVELTLGSMDFTLVQGPPGTGKTQFIAEVIWQTLKANPLARVLLVSQTHVALDNAIERLVRTGIENIVRIGRSDHPAIAASSKKYLVEAQLEVWSEELRTNSERFAESKARAIGISVDHAKALAKLSVIRSKLTLAAETNAYVQELSTSTTAGSPALDDIEESIERLTEYLDKLNKEIVELSLEVGQYLTGNLTIPAIIPSVEAVDNIVGAVIGNTKNYEKVLQVIQTQSAWIDRLGVSDDMTSFFIQSKRVIAGTCVGFLGQKGVQDIDFDLCILDEASKATSLEAIVPFARSSRWLLVGDTQQLQAKYIELERESGLLKEHELEKNDLKENLFTLLERELPEKNKAMLATQYRMIDPIGELVSKIFYGGRLKSDGPKRDEFLEKHFTPVRWISTSKVDSNRRSDDRDKDLSSFNSFEAEFLVNELGALDRRIEVFSSGGKRYSVLVIAPYNAQLRLIKQLYKGLNLKYLDVSFNSIDAVQGREEDIVFFSSVRSNSRGDTGFLSEENFQRVNVALSRARQYLCVIGDSDFWLNTPTKLGEVVDYLKENLEGSLEFIDAE